jgi:hypothetical protein
MAMEKQRRLVMVLLAKSKHGQLDWRPTLSNEVFQVASKDNTVRISDDEADGYRISIFNSDGQLVESFGPDSLAEGTPVGWVKVFGELFDLARRTALGTDKVLDDLLKSLGSSD